MLSQVIASARVTLPLSILLVLLSMVLGSVLGAVAGYFGKAVDEVIMGIHPGTPQPVAELLDRSS